MSSIWQCQNDINRYRNLKSKLHSILNSISSASTGVNNYKSEVSNKYLINDVPTEIVGGLRALRNDINDTYNYIQNKVIPAIDGSINALNNQVAYLERLEQERAERERKEKEERERREREENR